MSVWGERGTGARLFKARTEGQCKGYWSAIAWRCDRADADRPALFIDRIVPSRA